MEYEFDVSALLAPPDISKCKRILCVQPHPDDNEVGMGGVIAALTRKGCEAHYLTVTNGDKGNLDRSASPARTAAVRREEAQASGGVLGVTGFHFLDYGDGTLSDVLGLSEKIAGVIRALCPDAVFCPDPWLAYEGHWDHIVTGRAVSNAFQMSGRAHFPDASEPWQPAVIGYYTTSNPNTVIDVTETLEKKFAAMALHKSQFDARTLAMYRVYFEMKGRELAQGKGFTFGEGLKVLGRLHTHCFVDSDRI